MHREQSFDYIDRKTIISNFARNFWCHMLPEYSRPSWVGDRISESEQKYVTRSIILFVVQPLLKNFGMSTPNVTLRKIFWLNWQKYKQAFSLSFSSEILLSPKLLGRTDYQIFVYSYKWTTNEHGDVTKMIIQLKFSRQWLFKYLENGFFEALWKFDIFLFNPVIFISITMVKCQKLLKLYPMSLGSWKFFWHMAPEFSIGGSYDNFLRKYGQIITLYSKFGIGSNASENHWNNLRLLRKYNACFWKTCSQCCPHLLL